MNSLPDLQSLEFGEACRGRDAAGQPKSASSAKAARPRAGLKIREIRAEDIPHLAAMFSNGFRSFSLMRFTELLTQLSKYRQIDGFPQLGFLLEQGGKPVGALLTISSISNGGEKTTIRCNFACWYVEPMFRVYAGLLVNRLRPRLDTTYFNISPAAGTLKIIEAQGFQPFSSGAFACIPALAPARAMAQVDRLFAHDYGERGLSPGEWKILSDHESYGCISLICLTAKGTFPFVFRRRNFRFLPVAGAQLIYCRHIDEFTDLAQPVGRYLAQRGMPWVVIGCKGPLAGLRGKYIPDRWPMYYRGISPPRIGDLAYTERSLFGL